jgi:hypothetical protein
MLRPSIVAVFSLNIVSSSAEPLTLANRAVTVLRLPWKFSNSSEHRARFVAAAGLIEQPRETGRCAQFKRLRA